MGKFARLGLYLGVLAITPDAALLRWQRSDGASIAVILVWRYLLVTLLLALTAAWLHGGVRPLVDGARGAPVRMMCVAVVLQSLTNIGFTVSLILVEPAQALILISLSPVWAAGFGFVLLGETVDGRTLASLAVALASVGTMFAPAICGVSGDGGDEAGAPWANVVPLATGAAMASFVVSVRHLAKAHPLASIPAIPALGAALSCVGSVAFELSNGANLLPPLRSDFWPALGLNALAVAAYYCGISSSAKHVPPTEVAIAMLGETVLAPVWMVVFYGEVPSLYTIAGGALLLSALAVNELLQARGRGYPEVGLADIEKSSAKAARQFGLRPDPIGYLFFCHRRLQSPGSFILRP